MYTKKKRRRSNTKVSSMRIRSQKKSRKKRRVTDKKEIKKQTIKKQRFTKQITQKRTHMKQRLHRKIQTMLDSRKGGRVRTARKTRYVGGQPNEPIEPEPEPELVKLTPAILYDSFNFISEKKGFIDFIKSLIDIDSNPELPSLVKQQGDLTMDKKNSKESGSISKRDG